VLRLIALHALRHIASASPLAPLIAVVVQQVSAVVPAHAQTCKRPRQVSYIVQSLNQIKSNQINSLSTNACITKKQSMIQQSSQPIIRLSINECMHACNCARMQSLPHPHPTHCPVFTEA
jgi:hypothetical protein